MAEVPMEMDSTESKKGDKETQEKSGKAGQDADLITFEKLRENCRSLERGEATKEKHFVFRVLRALVTTRKTLNETVLTKIICAVLAPASAAQLRDQLLSYLKKPESSNLMEVDKKAGTGSARSPRSGRKTLTGSSQSVIPEVESYLHLLVVLFLIDQSRLQDAENCLTLLLKRLAEAPNKQTLDPLAAKAYYYYCFVMEKNKKLEQIRDLFHARLRTATLRHEGDSQATLINCLLRSYLERQLYSSAAMLVAKATFPDSANNNEWARHHYYLGKIKAMQMEYPDSQKNLRQSLRKSPQHTAIGFKQIAQKWLVVVDLLLGEIPERTLFRQPIYRKSLSSYLQLTQAVRTGDVQKFDEVLEKLGAEFERDGTHSLIVRLRQNVIKTAVKQISVAYSRISIPNIQKKLLLSHPDDAEYIVSKAIKDGRIEARLNHAEKFMQSSETADVYSTAEPQHSFHTRIAFCLELYNQAVKAMRFPPKSYSKDVESAEEQREREQQELEFAKELADDEDEF